MRDGRTGYQVKADREEASAAMAGHRNRLGPSSTSRLRTAVCHVVHDLPGPAVRRMGRRLSETNFDRHSLRGVGQPVREGREVEAPEPKDESGFRVVGLDDDMVGLPMRHRKQQEADRADWGMAWVEEWPRAHPLVASPGQGSRPSRYLR